MPETEGRGAVPVASARCQYSLSTSSPTRVRLPAVLMLWPVLVIFTLKPEAVMTVCAVGSALPKLGASSLWLCAMPLS